MKNEFQARFDFFNKTNKPGRPASFMAIEFQDEKEFYWSLKSEPEIQIRLSSIIYMSKLPNLDPSHGISNLEREREERE